MVNISSGIQAKNDVQIDLIQAEIKGTNAFTSFVNDRIKTTTVPFYDGIKRLNLRTFKSQHIKKTIKGKLTSITVERSMFGRLLILSQRRETIPLETLLSYSLSPIPWSLGLPDGGLVKTQKSKLLGN